MMQTMKGTSVLATSWVPHGDVTWEHAGRTVLAFLDAATTSFGRSTANNTRAEQQASELAVHDALLALDRGLYALFLLLPGVSDRARQLGVKNLLGLRADGETIVDERRILERLVAELPAQRVFKLFQALRVGGEGLRKANNARTRKLVLRVVLGSPRIELWSVKYRTKMAEALVHAWGRRMASVVRAILEKHPAERDAKDRSILGELVDKWASDVDRVRACVAFVLRADVPASLPLLVAYESAKVDLAAGAKLPPEVLEGIRGTFHRDAPKEQVLEVTKASMTERQKLSVQRRAAEAGVEVAFDPSAHDAVRLYLYAFERGMSEVIASALREKAAKAARALRLGYPRIGVLVDASASMAGAKDQPLRPMATALALRDVLVHAAEATVIAAGGEGGDASAIGSMIRPAGDTSLAEGLLALVERDLDAVFVLSDGYENRAAGRFAEVVAALRTIGIGTPILHLNPVFAAEAKGVRVLAEGQGATSLPVSGPEALGLSLVRGLLAADPERGIARLLEVARPALA